MTQEILQSSLHGKKNLRRLDTDPLVKGIASAVSSKFFREDDYIGEDGFRHCAQCKGAKEMIVSFAHTDIPDAVVPIACPCLNAERKAEEALYEEKQRQERIERIRKLGLRTDKLRQSRFEADVSKASQASTALRAYLSAWEKMKGQNYGLLLQGQVGTGKSFYAAAIANALIDRGERVYFVTAPEIVSIANDFSMYGRDRQSELERKIEFWDLLIVDDLGAQRGTEFGNEAIYNAINARYEAGRPMIVTTNMTTEELDHAQSIEEKRIVDRIREMCPVRVPVVGRSRRQAIREDRFRCAARILKAAMKEIEE